MLLIIRVMRYSVLGNNLINNTFFLIMFVPELNCFMIWIMKNPTLIVYIHTYSKRLSYTLQDQPINHVKCLKAILQVSFKM